MSEHDANTTAVRYVSRGVVHAEGGWPRDVDATEAEHTIRYRKKVCAVMRVCVGCVGVWWPPTAAAATSPPPTTQHYTPPTQKRRRRTRTTSALSCA